MADDNTTTLNPAEREAAQSPQENRDNGSGGDGSNLPKVRIPAKDWHGVRFDRLEAAESQRDSKGNYIVKPLVSIITIRGQGLAGYDLVSLNFQGKDYIVSDPAPPRIRDNAITFTVPDYQRTGLSSGWLKIKLESAFRPEISCELLPAVFYQSKQEQVAAKEGEQEEERKKRGAEGSSDEQGGAAAQAKKKQAAAQAAAAAPEETPSKLGKKQQAENLDYDETDESAEESASQETAAEETGGEAEISAESLSARVTAEGSSANGGGEAEISVTASQAEAPLNINASARPVAPGAAQAAQAAEIKAEADLTGQAQAKAEVTAQAETPGVSVKAEESVKTQVEAKAPGVSVQGQAQAKAEEEEKIQGTVAPPAATVSAQATRETGGATPASAKISGGKAGSAEAAVQAGGEADMETPAASVAPQVQAKAAAETEIEKGPSAPFASAAGQTGAGSAAKPAGEASALEQTAKAEGAERTAPQEVTPKQEQENPAKPEEEADQPEKIKTPATSAQAGKSAPTIPPKGGVTDVQGPETSLEAGGKAGIPPQYAQMLGKLKENDALRGQPGAIKGKDQIIAAPKPEGSLAAKQQAEAKPGIDGEKLKKGKELGMRQGQMDGIGRPAAERKDQAEEPVPEEPGSAIPPKPNMGAEKPEEENSETEQPQEEEGQEEGPEEMPPVVPPRPGLKQEAAGAVKSAAAGLAKRYIKKVALSALLWVGATIGAVLIFLLPLIGSMLVICKTASINGKAILPGVCESFQNISNLTGSMFTSTPPPISLPGGPCSPALSGPASVASLQTTCFGQYAPYASIIANAESGGDFARGSASDKCNADGKVFSWGLFQINLMMHPIKDPGTGNTLNCPAAFRVDPKNYVKRDANGKIYYDCQVKNQTLYDQCVKAAINPTANIQAACQISSNGKNWNAWSTNAKCSKVTP